MKKILFCIAIFFIVWSVVTGTASITISSPAQNDLWQPGTQHNIIWTKIGTQHQKVKIRLFDSSATQKLLEIANDTPNDESYLWTVPAGYLPGTYVIRVKTLDDQVKDDSDQFNIGNQPVENPEIDVTDPHLNAKWYRGETRDIKWDKSGTMIGSVKITLHEQPEMPPTITISSGASNTGNFTWKIPGTLKLGSYVIRVITSDGAASDYSKQFNIKQKFKLSEGLVPYNAKIEIIKPSVSSFWPNGKSHKIKWKNNFTKGKTVKIDLYNYSGNKFIKTIATLLPIIGKTIGKGKPSGISTYNWYIPKGTGPGKHRIKISRTDGVVSEMSDMFMIQAEIKTSVHKIYGVVSNHCKRHYWVKGHQGDYNHFAEQTDKIGCILNSSKNARVGYANHLIANKIQYYGFAYRSFVRFDLKPFQGKGIIVSAKLKYHKTSWPPGTNCSFSVYKVNAPFSNGFNVNAEYIGGPAANLNIAAATWLRDQNFNHGIMLVGPDETFQHNNSVCELTLNNIYLEIEHVGVL